MLLQGDEIESFEVNENGEFITSEVSEENSDKLKPDESTDSNQIEVDLELLGQDEENTGEEENKEKDEEKEKPSTQSQSNSSSTLNLQSLTAALREEGYLPNATEDEIKGVDSATKFAELIQKQIETNEYNDLPEDASEALKALRNGASWDEIVSFKKQETFNAKLDENSIKGDDKIDVRKDLITQYFKRTTSFSDERINKLVQKSIDTGTDEIDAIEYLKELKELDKSTLAEYNKQQEERAKQAKEAQENKVKALKETISKKDEIVPGIKFNQKQKDSLYKSIVEPVAKTSSGVPVNAFTNSYNTDEDFRLKVHALSVLTNNFTDFKALATKTKKSALAEIDKEISKTVNHTSNSPYDLNSDEEKNKAKGIFDFINDRYK